MWLKSLTLKGFLCYRDEVTVRFHPGFNVIVGPNGSGKSSILAGIRFVLACEDSGDRRAFLHQGKSSRSLSGYVIAHLDNTDARASGFDSQVTIRREFGLKRDELTINDKRITRKELQNLLESAGFSRSNPYFLVHQHEVTALARASPEDRYRVLKEVAGTQVYEARRAEAIANLERSRTRRAEIDASLRLIDRRVDELKEEREKLNKWLSLESQRKCLQGHIAKRQLEETGKELSELMDRKRELQGKLEELDTQLTQWKEAVERLNAEAEIKRAAADRIMAVEVLDLQRDIADRQVQVEYLHRQTTEYDKELQSSLKAFSQRQSRIKELEQSITTIQTLLDTDLRPSYDNMQKEARNVSLQLQAVRASLGALPPSGSTEEELTEALRKAEEQVIKLTTVKATHQQEISRLTTERREALRAGSCERVSAISTALDALQQRERSLKDEYDRFKDELASRVIPAMHHAERELARTIRPTVVTANQCILSWAQENDMLTDGSVLGVLIELIRVDPEYWVAVERAAGAELFNVLVKDASIARKAVEIIKARKAGGTTITPLKETKDRLRPFKDVSADGVRRLVSVVKYDNPLVELAVEQVFGRYLLVDSVDVGRRWASQGYDCITREGDTFSRKGVLSGGWQGNLTRLKWASQLTDSRSSKNMLEQSLRRIEHESRKVDDELASLQRRHREVSSARHTRRRAIEEIDQQLKVSQSNLEDVESELREAIEVKEDVQEQLLQLREACSSTNIKEASQQQQQTAEQLLPKLAELTAKHEEITEELATARSKLAEASKQLETEKAAIARLETSDTNQDMSFIDEIRETLKITGLELQRQHQRVNELKERVEAKRQRGIELQKQVENATKEVRELQNAIRQTEAERESLLGDFTECQSRCSTMLQRRSQMAQETVDVVGMSELLSEVENLSIIELSRRLNKVNKAITELGPTNKKAHDQFAEFITELEKFEKQRDELFAAENAVLKLIDTFDEQKTSTLIKTFENVNRSFSMIFSRIVKGGEAHLVLKRRSGDDDSGTTDAFVGVTVSLRFPGGGQLLSSLESLSGGQKSVAALSIIFALQLVDAAPIFVLDEVDAALDTSYRSTVSQVIKTQAKDHQVIVISHRPQLVNAADYWLSTTIVNQESMVTPVPLEEALAVSQRADRIEAKGTALALTVA